MSLGRTGYYFSSTVELGKLQKLFTYLRSYQLHHQAALGLLSRAARKHGLPCLLGYPLIILPLLTSSVERKLFLDGPIEWLQTSGMYLCRRGADDILISLQTPLYSIVPTSQVNLRNFPLLHTSLPPG